MNFGRLSVFETSRTRHTCRSACCFSSLIFLNIIFFSIIIMRHSGLIGLNVVATDIFLAWRVETVSLRCKHARCQFLIDHFILEATRLQQQVTKQLKLFIMTRRFDSLSCFKSAACSHV